MASHKIAHIESFQSTLDFYINQTRVPRMTSAELRLSILREFEDNDRRRGTPYLAITPEANTTRSISYTESVTFADGEEPYVPNKKNSAILSTIDSELKKSVVVETPAAEYLNDDEDTEDTEEVEEVVLSPSAFLSSITESDPLEDFSTRLESTEFSQEDKESEDSEESEESEVSDEIESDYDSGESGESGESDDSDDSDDSDEEETPTDLVEEADEEPIQEVKEVKRVVTEIPHRGSKVKKQAPLHPMLRKKRAEAEVKSTAPAVEQKQKQSSNDVFDQFDSMLEGVSPRQSVARKPPAKPIKEVITEYKTLREFVKNNPGCSVDLAKQYFPEKEIKKQINVGRIYYKNGKLTI